MLFNRNNRIPQTPANRAVNKVLTYGLIFFIIYAVYLHKDAPKMGGPVENQNLTRIDWGDYVVVRNLLNNDETMRRLNGREFTLELSKKDFQHIQTAGFNGQEAVPVYEIKLGDDLDLNSLISGCLKN